MRTDQAKAIRLSDYRPSDYLIDRVELDFHLHKTETRLTSRLFLRPNPAGLNSAPLSLDGDGLHLLSITLDDRPLTGEDYFQTPNQLILHQPPQRPFMLEIVTQINPSTNTQLMGLYRSGSAYCTQCEAEGFRRMTYFLDRPDILAIYRVRMEADRAEAPILLSNGNPIETGAIAGNDRHYAIWHDPHPKPSYLFALVAGNLGCLSDVFTTASGRKVDLGIYVEHGKESRAHYAMDALKRSMRWDEEEFGREYDLDIFNIVAISDFNMGAMENKGLNIFNDKYVLALPETATDADYINIEAIIAHEYFHNWTGNRITCRDWFQLCLKEGLTVFRDQEFSADQRSHAVRRIGDVKALRSQQFSEDAGPLAHNVRPETYTEINNFYTPTVYEKGAEIVRMLKTLIGADHFRAGMDLYFARHDGQAAIVEDFIRCFAEVSGRDLSHFMRWYQQAGTPMVRVSTHYDQSQQTFTLELSQSTAPTPGQMDKSPLLIPLQMGLISAEGAALPLISDDASAQELATGILELSQSHRKIVFQGLSHRPILSMLRQFSAPVLLSSDISREDLLILLAHDSDTFNRWQAAQSYATQLLMASVTHIRAGQPELRDPKFTSALASLLKGNYDPAFVAQALSLPSEQDLARDIAKDVDPDAIRQARQALKRDIGAALEAQLVTILDQSSVDAPFKPDAEGSGRRALAALALDYLITIDGAKYGPRVLQIFRQAKDMTNRFAALSALSSVKGDLRDTALAEFYTSFADDPLVIDKWFALQAMIPESETLEMVRALMAHPAFSFSNPNRLRALVGTFAMANPTCFNALDGSGYDFLSQLVLDIDKTNAQVAARLLVAFKSWKNLEPQRQKAARQALLRVQSAGALSTDLRDIVERSLA
ncbi:MAG: aminopeptidase N [Alphaproteobacteria bacterium]|nr:aminopeptidase N [Alphaproteobacteria bacterium]